jgi:hypothetical protein
VKELFIEEYKMQVLQSGILENIQKNLANTIQDLKKFTCQGGKWERNGRKGFSLILIVKQGEQTEKINVACSGEELIALADWMKELNTLLRYKEVIKVEEEGGDEPLPQPDDDIPVDEEELPDDIF